MAHLDQKSIDGHKKINGRKKHIILDVLGFIIKKIIQMIWVLKLRRLLLSFDGMVISFSNGKNLLKKSIRSLPKISRLLQLSNPHNVPTIAKKIISHIGYFLDRSILGSSIKSN